MVFSKDRKTELIGSYKTHDADTGSPEVQVAHPQRAHQLPDRTLQDPREGSPLAPRPADAGRPAPPPARLPEAQGRGPLRGPRSSAWTSASEPVRDPSSSTAHRDSCAAHSKSTMHTREISSRHRTLSDSKPASSPSRRDGSVIVRFGDSVVLVTACRAASPREGHRLPAADRRLPRIHLRLGTHPRRLLQARRQAGREGSADQPPDRSADPAAVPGRLALRDADHRARAVGRQRERHRRARDHRRLGGARALRHPVPEDDRRRPRRPGRRPVRRQPDLRAAQAAASST